MPETVAPTVSRATLTRLAEDYFDAPDDSIAEDAAALGLARAVLALDAQEASELAASAIARANAYERQAANLERDMRSLRAAAAALRESEARA